MIQKLKVNNKRITGDDLVTIVRKLNEVIEVINGSKTKESIVTTNGSSILDGDIVISSSGLGNTPKEISFLTK